MLLGLYCVGDCVMHLCPICNRRTINVLDDDDDDDDDLQATLSKLLTYGVLRSTQPPILSGMENE